MTPGPRELSCAFRRSTQATRVGDGADPCAALDTKVKGRRLAAAPLRSWARGRRRDGHSRIVWQADEPRPHGYRPPLPTGAVSLAFQSGDVRRSPHPA
jgi:hypothetical protein